MKNLRFICAQPTSLFYAWQVEVLVNNFIDMGINPNNIDIVSWKINGVIPVEWVKLTQKYPVNFHFYNDTRETKHYISSIRPNILKQHFEAHPELENEAIFYHDCDIVFTKPIDLISLIHSSSHPSYILTASHKDIVDWYKGSGHPSHTIHKFFSISA